VVSFEVIAIFCESQLGVVGSSGTFCLSELDLTAFSKEVTHTRCTEASRTLENFKHRRLQEIMDIKALCFGRPMCYCH
jgi:hypothetical protein